MKRIDEHPTSTRTGRARRRRISRRVAVAATALIVVPLVAALPAAPSGAAEPSPVPPQPVPYPNDMDPDEVEAYLEATSLQTEPGTSELVDASGGEPVYDETVTVDDDVVTIERTLDFRLAAGACEQPSPALAEHCFTVDPSARVEGEVAEELATIRRRLQRARSSSTLTDGVTVREARRMTDAELLDLVLNRGSRRIRRVSIVARERFAPQDAGVATDDGDSTAAQSPSSGPTSVDDQENTTDDGSTSSSPPTTKETWYDRPHAFATDHLLTGFTHHKRLSDEWEYTWAEETWWHGRYYVRFDYFVDLAFGIRVPFSIDVDHREGDPDASVVDIRVRPVDVDAQGSPAYPAVGLDSAEYFEGNEFILGVSADCSLEISIPGPDPEIDPCNGARKYTNHDWNRNVVPPLGDEAHVLKDWWLEGSKTGLELRVWFAEASVDLGVAAEITNGRIGYDVVPHASTALSGVGDGSVWTDADDPVAVGLNRQAPGDLGFTVADPRYGFDLALQPKVRLNASVDVGIYAKSVSRTFDLEFLEFGIGFELDHHEGTVASHPYTLVWSGTQNDTGTGSGGSTTCCTVGGDATGTGGTGTTNQG